MNERIQISNEQHPNRRPLMVLAITAVMITMMACSLVSRALNPQSGGAQPTSSSKTGSTGNTGQDTAVPSEEQELKPTITLPRSFQYADMKVSVTDAVITSVPPVDFSAGDAQKFAILSIQVENPTKDSIYTDGGQFKLQLGDGKTYKLSKDLSSQPRDTTEDKLVFAVSKQATWNNAELSFDQLDKEPATLALDGDQPSQGYPSQMPAGGQAQLKSPTVMYQVTEASLDLDAFGKRAGVGRRYVLLTVNATCSDKYNCYVGPESFRLLVDGKPMAAEKLDPPADAINSGSSSEFHLAFQIIDAAKAIVLEVGEADKDTAQIPLDLNSAKP